MNSPTSMIKQVHERNQCAAPAEETLARIDELLIDLPEDSDTLAGLMREHLEDARWYLLASMHREFVLTLKLAARLLADMRDHDLRARISEFLKGQHVVTHVH